MPEGDTLYRAATTLRKALLNRIVTRFDASVPQVEQMAAALPVVGRVVSAVESRGKHLLITFAVTDAPAGSATGEVAEPTDSPPALVLHTHLRMTGSWHVYRPGEAWQKPTRYAKVVIYTDVFVAPCFSAPVVELLTASQARRHSNLVELGPDAITEEFDSGEALRRMRRLPEVEIGVALMNQRVLSGVGNVYKSEVLFLQRLSPFARVGELPDETLAALIAESHRLLRLNRERGARRTMFGLNERDRLWVYGRSGEPCRICTTLIRMRRQGLDGRSTYYCPACQAAA